MQIECPHCGYDFKPPETEADKAGKWPYSVFADTLLFLAILATSIAIALLALGIGLSVLFGVCGGIWDLISGSSRAYFIQSWPAYLTTMGQFTLILFSFSVNLVVLSRVADQRPAKK